MIWALYGILILTLIIVSMIGFLALQSVSQSLANALSTIERVHANDGKRIDQVLDRLLAKDFEMFKSYQLAEESDVGGMEVPEEEIADAEIRVEVPGLTMALGANELERLAAERRIVMEDFPEEVVG